MTGNEKQADAGTATGRVVLALNSGSTSLKFALYRSSPTRPQLIYSGEVEGIGGTEGEIRAQAGNGETRISMRESLASQEEAIHHILQLFDKSGLPDIAAIGHRVVHGGPRLREHRVIDAFVLEQLVTAIPFAPVHAPAALAVIRCMQGRFPRVPQVACFDTAFHADMADIACVLPIPKELRTQGIHRYGFHGLSCESIVHALAADMPDRLIVAHLGGGSSITAVRHGQSFDTSMGMTPSGGVIMGERSGDLDPGVLIYLMREKKLDAVAMEDLLDRRSGMLGISGFSSDMRRLHATAPENEDARLAIRMFCYSVAKQIAAMTVALDGVDTVVFTGGIGENDAKVRAAICAHLACIGISLDDSRNRAAENPINDSASRCRVRVLASQEDEMIARHTAALVIGRTSRSALTP